MLASGTFLTGSKNELKKLLAEEVCCGITLDGKNKGGGGGKFAYFEFNWTHNFRYFALLRNLSGFFHVVNSACQTAFRQDKTYSMLT